MIVTIDPGKKTGWALHSKTGLVACGTGDPRISDRHIVVSPHADVDVIEDAYIEWPVIYPRAPARPADIMKVARCAAEYGGMYKTFAVDVHYVEPAEWKGQLDKAVHHPIILATLTAEERSLVYATPKIKRRKPRYADDGYSEDMLDAIGLALWAARRWGRR